ncbi:MAG: hypothetical protein WCT04_21350 [Planctomycetota bacterium]
MASSSPVSGSCLCGKVVFDLSERRTGETLNCAWCGQNYHYLGGGTLKPINAYEAKLIASAPPVRSGKPRPKIKRSDGPPGGMLPMLGFIIAFNVIAFTAVSLLLPKHDDGLRHAVWDASFTISAKSFWPDVGALVLGHLLGFICWAVYAYSIHRRERMEQPT